MERGRQGEGMGARPLFSFLSADYLALFLLIIWLRVYESAALVRRVLKKKLSSG